VEQDLVLSRALVEMFNNPLVREALAFRGGTALHKLFFEQPRRYSEDIDLVQREAAPIGPVLDAIRTALDPWLGDPRRSRGQGRVKMLYRFDTTTLPVRSMRLKIEINTREHIAVLGFVGSCPAFCGKCLA
jgi:predicted nucleotidyltransferase component of viral defense system